VVGPAFHVADALVISVAAQWERVVALRAAACMGRSRFGGARCMWRCRGVGWPLASKCIGIFHSCSSGRPEVRVSRSGPTMACGNPLSPSDPSPSSHPFREPTVEAAGWMSMQAAMLCDGCFTMQQRLQAGEEAALVGGGMVQVAGS
jgi:hypothetical protein